MALSPLSRAQIRASQIEAIQEHVARMSNMCVEELNQRSRTRAVTVPRHMAMYLARQLTDASLMEIGGLFGDRDHTTVKHAVNRIEVLRRKDPAIDLAISMLLRTLNQVGRT